MNAPPRDPDRSGSRPIPRSFDDLFPAPRPVIAMVHIGPSPGVAGFEGIDGAVRRAVEEARLYREAGVDGLLVENMHDFPCVREREMGPEVAAFMTRVATAVKAEAGGLPVGVQVLFQANRTALAVALAAGCDFVRAEGWTYAHVSDKGIADASAGRTLRYRHAIAAGHLPVFADVKKKHAAHAWTADLTLALHGADAAIITGTHTGQAPSEQALRDARAATTLPLLVGSGATPENAMALAALADGFIVGSAFKEGGQWDAPVNPARIRALLHALQPNAQHA